MTHQLSNQSQERVQMKLSTKNQYYATIMEEKGKLQQMVAKAPAGDQVFMDKWKGVWNSFMDVSKLLDDNCSDTVRVSNALQISKRSVSWLERRVAGEEELLEVDVEIEEAPAETSVQKRMAELIRSAQQLMLQAYAEAVDSNVLAAEVPAIRELQGLANRVGSIVSDICKIRGL